MTPLEIILFVSGLLMIFLQVWQLADFKESRESFIKLFMMLLIIVLVFDHYNAIPWP